MIIRNSTHDVSLHVDFVPMADVLFNLLIFFLLATSMVQSEREMKIALPQASAAGPISVALREIVINVDAQGQAIVAGESITDDSLASMVKSAIATNSEQKVSIRGDRTTAYANIARVLDVCKGAGMTEPFLETIPAQ